MVEKRYRVYKVGGVWSFIGVGVYPFNIVGLPPFNRVGNLYNNKSNNKNVYIMTIIQIKAGELITILMQYNQSINIISKAR